MVRVLLVKEGSPLEGVVLVGDIVVSVGGKPVNTVAEAIEALGAVGEEGGGREMVLLRTRATLRSPLSFGEVALRIT